MPEKNNMVEGAAPLEMPMQPNAVKLSVTASVPMNCVFWPEDDGWTGVCEELSVTARGNNFQQAKREMEAELQAYIESFLRSRKIAA
jgi:hypothetical protein